MDEEHKPKVWQRPWTTDEMRQQSANWNLAGDAGLLQHLQQFSQNLLAKTHSCEKALDSVKEQLSATTLEVHNVTNQFLSLANTQFVENRVYDDEKETPPEERKDEESISKEKQEAETLACVHEALTLGMHVLDSMFDAVEVPGSDSDEDGSIGGRVVLKPHDPYRNRPLPYLIGSREFMEDDKIGLDTLSDTEEMCSNKNQLQSSESESESSTGQLGMAKKRARLSISVSENSDTESEENRMTVDPIMRKQQKMFEDDLHGDTENMFGEVTQERTDDTNKVDTFASELAAKLGGVVTTDGNEPPINSNKASIVWGIENADDNDSLFAHKSNKFYRGGEGGGGGLFDDLEDDTSGPLWEANHGASAPHIGKKAGDMEGSLFDPDDDSEDLFTAQVSAKVVSSQSSSAFNEKGMITSTPDFDEPVQNDRKKLCSQDISKIGSPLFDSAGEDEDLFRIPSAAASADSLQQSNYSSKDGIKKMPAGAVSMFGGIDVFKTNLARPPSSSSDGSESSLPVGEQGVLITSSNTSSGVMTMSISQDQSSKRAVEEKPATAASLPPPTVTQKLTSLFNDSDSGEDDVLFSSTSSASSRSRKSQGSGDPLAAATEKAQQKNLFENDDELFGGKKDEPDFDIFSTKSEASSAVPQDTLGDDDNEDLFKNSSNIPAPKSTSSQIAKLDPSNTSLFEEHDHNFDIFEVTKKPFNLLSEVSSYGKDSLSAVLNKDTSAELFIDDINIFQSTNDMNSALGSSGDLEDDTEDLFANVPKSAQAQRKSKNSHTINLFSTDIFEDEDNSIFSISKAITSKLDDKQKLPNNVLSKLEEENISKDTVKDVNIMPNAKNVNNERHVSVDISKDNSAKPAKNEKPMPPTMKPTFLQQPVITASQANIENISVPVKSEVNEHLKVLDHDPSLSENATVQKDNELLPEKQIQSSAENRSSNIKNDGSPVVLKLEPPKSLNIRRATELLFSSSSVDDEDASSSWCKGVDFVHASSAENKDTNSATHSSAPEIVIVQPSNFSFLGTEKQNQLDKVIAQRLKSEKKISTHVKSSPGLTGEVKSVDSLNIDATTLLPGIKPPKSQDNAEVAVGFDHPAQLNNTLHSVGKNRARIQVKRRPQSRHARHEAIRSSDLDYEEHTEVSSSNVGNKASCDNFLQSSGISVLSEKQEILSSVKQNVSSSCYKDKPSNPLSSTVNLNYSLTEPFLSGNSNPLSPSTDEEDLFGVPSDLPSEYGNNSSQNLFASAPVLSPLELPSSSSIITNGEAKKVLLLAPEKEGPKQKSSLTTNDKSTLLSSKLPDSTLFKYTENSNCSKQDVKQGLVNELLDNHIASGDSDKGDLFSEPKKQKPLLEIAKQDLFDSRKERDGLFTKEHFMPKQDISDELFSKGADHDIESQSISSLNRNLVEEKSKDISDNSLFISSGSQHNSLFVEIDKESFTPNKKSGLADVEENAADLLFSSHDNSLSNSIVSVINKEVQIKRADEQFSSDDKVEEENLFRTGMYSNSSAKLCVNTATDSKLEKKMPVSSINTEDIFAYNNCEHEDLFKAPTIQSLNKTGTSVKGSNSLFGEDDDDIFRGAKGNIKTASSSVTKTDDLDTYFASLTSKQTGSRHSSRSESHTKFVKKEDRLFEDPLMVLKK